MGIGSAVAGVGALVGGIAGSHNSGGQTSTSSTAPWAPQQPYIGDAYSEAEHALQFNNANPVQQYVAGQNGAETSAETSLEGASGYGANLDPWASSGANLTSFAPNYGANAYNLSQNGIGSPSASTGLLAQYAQTGELPGTSSSIDTGLQSSINGASMGGLGSLTQGASLAAQAGAAGLNTSGNLATIENAGNNYASNPALQSSIEAQEGQINNSLTTNSLPAIQAASTGTGNVNSSREGALEGQAITGAELTDASLASSMENNAYNTGAGLASNQITSGLSAANTAATNLNGNGSVSGNLGLGDLGLEQNQTQFGTTSALNAASTAGSQDLGYAYDNANAELNANAQLGNSVALGQNLTSGYINGELGLDSTALAAGQQQQAGAQQIDQNAIDMAQQPWTQLDNYWNIVGQNEGQTATSTTTPNNGGLSGALTGAIGLGTAGYGLASNYGMGTLAVPSSGIGSTYTYAPGQSVTF